MVYGPYGANLVPVHIFLGCESDTVTTWGTILEMFTGN